MIDGDFVFGAFVGKVCRREGRCKLVVWKVFQLIFIFRKRFYGAILISFLLTVVFGEGFSSLAVLGVRFLEFGLDIQSLVRIFSIIGCYGNYILFCFRFGFCSDFIVYFQTDGFQVFVVSLFRSQVFCRVVFFWSLRELGELFVFFL